MSHVGGHQRGQGSFLRQAGVGVGLVTALAGAVFVVAWLLSAVIALVW